MQNITLVDKPMVIVDYAHTPDALKNVLITLRELLANKSAKLICVFGCGGNRDRLKRPLMAKIANEYADNVIITSDNPRNENPQSIIDEIYVGITKIEQTQVILERKTAIQAAISQAKVNDIILIAGKGNENYQIIAGVNHYFSDYETALELLQD